MTRRAVTTNQQPQFTTQSRPIAFNGPHLDIAAGKKANGGRPPGADPKHSPASAQPHEANVLQLADAHFCQNGFGQSDHPTLLRLVGPKREVEAQRSV